MMSLFTRNIYFGKRASSNRNVAVITKDELSFNISELTFVGKDIKQFKLLFLNSLIKEGKKIRAEKWVNLILFKLKHQIDGSISHFDVMFYTFIRLRPLVVLRPVKIGRALYRLPM